jgi:ACS family hexuronate transporter-like MFS transporter
MLAQDKQDVETTTTVCSRWRDLLALPQTWGVIAARTLTDPVWYFVADWFPIYLVAKGINLRSGIVAVWVPFLAADLGNFFGGFASGWLIKHGWPLGRARKAVVVFGGIGVTALIPTIWTANMMAITSLFALATFCYASFSTIANVLPTDLYEAGSVASVSGISGTGSSIGTIIAFYLIGHYSDLSPGVHQFDPVIAVAGLVPFFGMLLVLLLVRNTEATRRGLVRQI